MYSTARCTIIHCVQFQDRGGCIQYTARCTLYNSNLRGGRVGQTRNETAGAKCTCACCTCINFIAIIFLVLIVMIIWATICNIINHRSHCHHCFYQCFIMAVLTLLTLSHQCRYYRHFDICVRLSSAFMIPFSSS